MALTFFQTVKGEKSFKRNSIAKISKSFWIFGIFPTLKDWEWTHSVEMGMEVGSSIILSDYTYTHVTVDYPYG